MELHDILIYLELDNSASLAEMKTRIEDKLKKLEILSESMGSDFQKRMHQKNIDKAVKIKTQIMKWHDEESAMPVQPAPVMKDRAAGEMIEPNPAAVQQDSAFIFTTPVIIGSKSKMNLQNARSKDPLGWLVRHTEKQTAVTFTLYAGKNYLGRKKQQGLANFITIDDDVFISRVHAVIDAEDGNDFEFYISDNESSNLGKPSKNGTYINGDEKRINQKARLSENDTIQVGLTKLILKINWDNNLIRIIKEVQGSKFMDTVIINSE